MRIRTLTIFLLLAAIATPHLSRSADGATVHAVLIIASKEKAAADPRLAPYEAQLQRNLPESSFRLLEKGSAAIAPTGQASISLGSGHRVDLVSSGKEDGGIRLKVEWFNGKTLVLNYSFTFRAGGIPVVLGSRPSGDGDVPLIIITSK